HCVFAVFGPENDCGAQRRIPENAAVDASAAGDVQALQFGRQSWKQICDLCAVYALQRSCDGTGLSDSSGYPVFDGVEFCIVSRDHQGAGSPVSEFGDSQVMEPCEELRIEVASG